MRKSYATLSGCLIVLGAFVVLTKASESRPKPNPELSAMMRLKLHSSEKIVEGLVSRDFQLITKGAEELTQICNATEWRAHEDQVYAHYRDELRRTAKKIVVLADDKNLDGVAYSYMHSLSTCINCHSYCRDVLRIASLDGAPSVTMIPTSEEEAKEHHRKATRR